MNRPADLTLCLSFALALAVTVSLHGRPRRAARPASSPGASCRPPRFGQLSPPSGRLFSATERATAAANGIRGPAQGPPSPREPVQGFSSMVPGELGTWWALADNGYAWRPNSGRLPARLLPGHPRWNDPAGRRIDGTVVLHDPDRRIPWTIACDPTAGDAAARLLLQPLPVRPGGVRRDPSARILTRFDLDRSRSSARPTEPSG